MKESRCQELGVPALIQPLREQWLLQLGRVPGPHQTSILSSLNLLSVVVVSLWPKLPSGLPGWHIPLFPLLCLFSSIYLSSCFRGKESIDPDGELDRKLEAELHCLKKTPTKQNPKNNQKNPDTKQTKPKQPKITKKPPFEFKPFCQQVKITPLTWTP